MLNQKKRAEVFRELILSLYVPHSHDNSSNLFQNFLEMQHLMQ